MKNITSTILTIAMLVTLTACGGNNGTSGNITGATGNGITTEATGDVPSEITEPKLDENDIGLPVYTTNRNVTVFTEISNEYDNNGYVPEKYVVRFEEAPTIALTVKTNIDPHENKVSNTIVAIYVADYKYECNINAFDRTSFRIVYTDDVICVIRPGASTPGDAVFVSKQGILAPDEFAGYCVFAEADVENESNCLRYTLEDQTLYSEMRQLTHWAKGKNGGTVYRITGKIVLSDNKITMAEESRMTLAEYYLTDEMEKFRNESGCTTFDEYKAKTERELILQSDSGFMYELMDKTFGEIETEFVYDENLRYGGISDNGTQTIYVTNGGIEYQLTYTVEDYRIEGSDTYEFSEKAKPRTVTAYNFNTPVYPGIKSSMTAAEVSKIIPKWDGFMTSGNYRLVTYYELGGLTYSVNWKLDDEISNYFNEASLEYNSVQVEKMRYEFAQKFIENMSEYSATVDTVSINKSKYADYVPPKEPEYISPADELAMCTVYDVTSDKDSYHGPFNEWLWKDTEVMPKKIALRFTDLDGLTLIMDIAEDVYFNKSIYYVTRILSGNVDIVIPHHDGFRYIYDSIYVKRVGEITVVAHTSRGSERFYVINGDEYDIIRNWHHTDSVYNLVKADDGFSYIKYSWDYQGILIRPTSTVSKYVANEHFCEYGKLVFENGEAEFVKEGDMTFEEWYLSDLFKWKKQRDEYKTETFEELAKIYEEQSQSERDEFWD